MDKQASNFNLCQAFKRALQLADLARHARSWEVKLVCSTSHQAAMEARVQNKAAQ